MNICYAKDDDTNIANKEFIMTSTDNKTFHTESWYLNNNIKIQMNYVPNILFASLTARKLFYYIVQIVPYNSNIISLDRKDILKYLNTNDRAVITKGLKELIELGIIKRMNEHDKNLYALTMNAVVRGNVDVMVKQYNKEKEEAEFAASQKLCIKSYNQLFIKHKNKSNNTYESTNSKQIF